eukprot:scaffold407_cov168-Amphora_coffeaeformis.AAC.20
MVVVLLAHLSRQEICVGAAPRSFVLGRRAVVASAKSSIHAKDEGKLTGRDTGHKARASHTRLGGISLSHRAARCRRRHLFFSCRERAACLPSDCLRKY